MKKVSADPCRIAFLLLDNFTMISLASAIDPLRMANQLSGKILYDWFTITEDGQPVRASDGLNITPEYAIGNAVNADILVVAGGVSVAQATTSKITAWLRHLSRQGYTLGSTCTGAYALAEAGLLNGFTCSTHWEYLKPLQEDYPQVRCSDQLFSIDEKRMTASGGTAPMDMMLHMIGISHGAKLAVAISEMFVQERIRSDCDSQKVPLRNALGTSQPKLVEVVGIMEAHIEDTLTVLEIASRVELSRRQLERLFKKYLNCSPSSFYLDMRLQRARQLLIQTSMPVLEIGIACGFCSQSHFSKVYHERMGVPPSRQRQGLYQKEGKQQTQNTASTQKIIETPDMMVAMEAFDKARSEPTFGSVSFES